MATIKLRLTDGQTFTNGAAVNGTVEEIRDELSRAIEAGAAVNMNEPGRVIVVNSAHILYAVVTA